jgi:4-amino-4-deoxy-L-arabinose transferase-like glycosyltransferase
LLAWLVGLGFNIKMLQAFMVLPAIYLLYWLSPALATRKKIGHLLAATVVLLIVSLSWAAVVDLTPADQRPYVGSSQTLGAEPRLPRHPASCLALPHGHGQSLVTDPPACPALIRRRAPPGTYRELLEDGGPTGMPGGMGGLRVKVAPRNIPVNQQLAGRLAGFCRWLSSDFSAVMLRRSKTKMLKPAAPGLFWGMWMLPMLTISALRDFPPLLSRRGLRSPPLRNRPDRHVESLPGKDCCRCCFRSPCDHRSIQAYGL